MSETVDGMVRVSDVANIVAVGDVETVRAKDGQFSYVSSVANWLVGGQQRLGGSGGDSEQ